MLIFYSIKILNIIDTTKYYIDLLRLFPGLHIVLSRIVRTNEVPTQVKDEILIKLADEGVYYQALAKLKGI
jgi:hypothetical protein